MGGLRCGCNEAFSFLPAQPPAPKGENQRSEGTGRIDRGVYRVQFNAIATSNKKSA